MTRFTLRLPDSLHKLLEEQARREQVSLNQFLVYALTRQVTADYFITATPPEYVRQQREAWQALLTDLGTASPEEVQRAMDEREQVEPEPDLDPELVERLRLRINEARESYETAPVNE